MNRIPSRRTNGVESKREKEIGQRYFQRIKEIWAPVAGHRLIIPFCTPVVLRPTALVIGTNHSVFAKDTHEAERIANEFASTVPVVNTYLEHNHTFARGLRAACDQAGICLDATWMGTNRCAVQTDSKGIGEIEGLSEFSKCQAAMDVLLRELVDELCPRNVILTGKYAWDLYPHQGIASWNDHRTKDGNVIRVIRVKHFSRGGFRDDIVTKLVEAFRQK